MDYLWSFIPQEALDLPPMYLITGIVSFFVCQILCVVTHKLFSDEQLKMLPTEMDRTDLKSRSASTIHSVIVFFMILGVILYDFFLDNARMFNDPVHAHNSVVTLSMAIGVGYFFSDLILVVVYQLPPVFPMVLHHVFASAGFLSIIVFQKFEYIVCLLYIAEGANPWYNIWWLCNRKVVNNFSLYQLCGKMFVYSWIVCRLAMKPIVIFLMWKHWDEATSSRPLFCFIIIMTNVVFLTLLDYGYFVTGPFLGLLKGDVDASDSFGVFESKDGENEPLKKKQN
eukprot:TRINITY_DN10898_c0_g1_i2.p1 TRINITY_DN10898_c0_g1~~TRINITY_DN10898_c0_g1_i2.p1  ORF type:complete len:283 (+),score=113.82 TRINITY_DN10898_c0_g1_i2:56-904(+)